MQEASGVAGWRVAASNAAIADAKLLRCGFTAHGLHTARPRAAAVPHTRRDAMRTTRLSLPPTHAKLPKPAPSQPSGATAAAPPAADGGPRKLLHIVRHAEGFHNTERKHVAERSHDARLTPNGEAQCAALRAALGELAAFSSPSLLVVASPLTRTLQTATLTFGAAYGAGPAAGGPPFLATELARERIAAHTCDGRRSRAEQAAEFAHVDFSELESDEDALFHSAKEDEPTEFASERCFARAGELLAWLHGRPEQRIAVVSHWVFLRHLLTRFAADASLQENFGNAEMREVALVPTNRTACYAGS